VKMSSQETEILVQVLDEKYKLSDFALKYINEELYEWEKGGITDPIGQLITWLWGMIDEALNTLRRGLEGFITTVRDQIVNSVTSFVDTVYKGITSAIDAVSSTINTVIDSLGSITSFLNDFYNSVVSSFESLGLTLTVVVDFLNQIWSILEGLASQITSAIVSGFSTLQAWINEALNVIGKTLGDVWNTLQGLASQISTWFNNLASSIAGIATSIYNYLQGFTTTLWINIQGGFSTLQNWVGNAFKTVSQTLTQLATTVTTGIESLWRGFQDLGAAIIGGFQSFTKMVADSLASVQGFFLEQYNKLASSVTTITQTLQGFINPLVNIYNWLTNLPKQLTDIAKNLSEWLISGLSDIAKGIENIAKTLWDRIVAFGKWLAGALQNLGRTLLQLGSGLLTGLGNIAKGFTEAVGGWFKGVVEGFLTQPIQNLASDFRKIVEEKYKEGKLGELEIWVTLLPTFIGMLTLPRVLAGLIKSAGLTFVGTEITIGIPGTNIRFPFKPGLFAAEMGSALWDISGELIRALGYGFAIWISRPFTRAVNATVRNWLPVELPTLDMVIEATRRTMPTTDFKNMLESIKKTMALYGYSDFVISWYTKLHTEKYVEIEDRFGVKRKFPISLLYQLPSGSDLCRMMVRDVFGKPENPFPSFAKAIQTRGYNVDVASMYYMLHFRYPPMDKLWEFACRCAVGLAWVTETPRKEGNLGASDAKAPVDLNADVKTVEALTQHLNNWIANYLKYYSKWHDYAPFAWVKGFTADRLIVMDLMADIPMRIDVRWMYKWKIVEDLDVFRIVVARGMHPRWVEKITVAECMNALQEERTLARTGVINAYKEGFTTEQLLTQTLSKLTTVKIMGKDWDVRFLEGEIKLLALRARYDRSLDILRDYSRELIRSAADNIMTFTNVVANLGKSIDQVAQKLGISLSLDSTYFDAYKPVVSTMFNIYTIHRVRIWIRYMMYRILTRFSQGYLTKAEIEKLIQDLVEKGKLTELEKALLQDVADIMLQYFLRRSKANAVLKKLSRGAIGIEDARRELSKLGLDKETIDALIEERAKLYTISIDKLVSMMEYIPIDMSKFKEKMELMGVPEDEKRLYVPYAFAREIKSELDKYVTEVLKDFEDGVIDKREAERELNEIATLWGEAKKVFGVDWIIYSPDERKLLLMVYEKRRLRKERRRGR